MCENMGNILPKYYLFIYIFVYIDRVTCQTNENKCPEQGVMAVDTGQIYVPPGFDVYVEENSTVLIDTGIGSDVEDEICFAESRKDGSQKQITCVPSYLPGRVSGYFFEVIKNNTKRYTWTLKLWNFMSNPGKVEWWSQGYNNGNGSSTVTVLDRNQTQVNIRTVENANISVVKYFAAESITDIGFDGPHDGSDEHYFNLGVENGVMKGYNQIIYCPISPFYAHKQLSINFWNVNCGRKGQYTLSVTNADNILVILTINENLEVNGEVLKEPTFSFDTTKVMCSANKPELKIQWFDNGVQIPEGESGYGMELNDNSSILTIEYANLKPNSTMEYMCWVSTDCSEGKNRTISIDIPDIAVCPPCNRSIECPTDATLFTRETTDYSASIGHTEINFTNSTICKDTGNECYSLLWKILSITAIVLCAISNIMWITLLCCVRWNRQFKEYFVKRIKFKYISTPNGETVASKDTNDTRC